MAPNDDLWRDDGHISADITAMEDFAQKLLADVDDHYAPFADTLANRMLAGLPAADRQFGELYAFTTVLASAQDTCQQNMYNFANGTHGFAKAAEQVSAEYRGSDAFAHARLSDVEQALVTAGLLPPPASPASPDPASPDTASPGATSSDTNSPGATSSGAAPPGATSAGAGSPWSGSSWSSPPAPASPGGSYGDSSVPFNPAAEGGA